MGISAMQIQADTGMAVLLLLALVCEVVGDQAGDQDGVDGLAYLARYGYLTTQDQDTSQNIPQHSPVPGQAQDISQAVTKFQNFAGLKATGVLDQETLELMKTPRCGVQDFYIQSDTTGNVSAPYRTLTKWTSKTVLSWRVTKFSSKLTRSQVVNSVWKAFQFWSSVTNLKFFEKTTGEVDIPIEFVTYDHGDGNPFDGPGGTLAHAYYPETGDIHVDDTEDWTLDSSQGTNFLQTLTHEIGHSIGLDHSTNNKAVMFPFIQQYSSQFSLHLDDILGAQSLYGSPESTTSPSTGRPVTYPPIPSFSCPDTNTNTQGRKSATILDEVKSWSACSVKCSTTPTCRYWTWHHAGAGEYSYRCILMEDVLGKVEDKNAISGTRKCVCPLMSTNTRSRQGSVVLDNLASWQACGEKCSQTPACRAWTWHHSQAGEFSLRCVLMAGYGALVQDTNAVSGAKQCN